MAQPEEGILADGLDSLDKAPKKKKEKRPLLIANKSALEVGSH
jgi:hypothetical protein